MAYMMRVILALALPAALLVACGASGSNQQGSSTATGGPAAAGAVPTAPEDTGGLARQGEACDYGGAERYTCTGGLECCYGDAARPDGYGSCQAECNWDD